jgi:hypothetical protein
MNEKKIKRDIRGCKIVEIVAAIAIVFPIAGSIIMIVLLEDVFKGQISNNMQFAYVLLILAGLLFLVMALGFLIVSTIMTLLRRQGEQTLQLIQMVRGGQTAQLPGQV